MKITDEKIIDDPRPIRERIAFDENFFEKLSEKCLETTALYRYKHNELFEAAKKRNDLREEYYSKAMDDIYVPRISSLLGSGGKTGMLSDEQPFDGIKYYIDDAVGRPVFSENYFSGKTGSRTFYFYEDNRLTAAKFDSAPDWKIFRFGHITETEFTDGNIIASQMFYNDKRITWYDRYIYDDGRLGGCESFDFYEFGSPMSFITDKVSEDGIFYGDKNPTAINTYRYIYNEKNVISEIECTCFNLEKVIARRYAAKSAEYKKLKKAGFIV